MGPTNPVRVSYQRDTRRSDKEGHVTKKQKAKIPEEGATGQGMQVASGRQKRLRDRFFPLGLSGPARHYAVSPVKVILNNLWHFKIIYS